MLIKIDTNRDIKTQLKRHNISEIREASLDAKKIEIYDILIYRGSRIYNESTLRLPYIYQGKINTILLNRNIPVSILRNASFIDDYGNDNLRAYGVDCVRFMREYVTKISEIKCDNPKIMIRQLNGGLGDYIIMTPIFKQLRKMYPHAIIAYEVAEKAMPLFYGNQNINLMLSGLDEEDLADGIEFNCVCDITDIYWKYEKENKEIALSRCEIALDYIGLQCDSYLPDLYVSDEANEDFLKVFCSGGINRKKIGLGLISDRPEKTWNKAYIQKLIDALIKYGDVYIFNNELTEFENCIQVYGNHKNWFAGIKNMDYMIVTDTAHLHIAAAFEKPTIALFGSTNPLRVCKHYLNFKTIIQKESKGKKVCNLLGCNTACQKTGKAKYACMNGISVADVLESFKTIIGD